MEKPLGRGRASLVDSEKILLTVRDVAALTGFSVGTLYHWISQRRDIPYIRISARCVRFRRSDIEAWISGMVVAPSDLTSQVCRVRISRAGRAAKQEGEEYARR
jgi:excisionase family DNA binding protein